MIETQKRVTREQLRLQKKALSTSYQILVYIHILVNEMIGTSNPSHVFLLVQMLSGTKNVGWNGELRIMGDSPSEN